MRRRRKRPLHLLELGLAWPPDTFLREKYAGLASRGVRVTVVTYRQSSPTFELPGVELVPMPTRGQPLRHVVRGLATDVARLAAHRPRRLASLINGPNRALLRHQHGPQSPYTRERRHGLEWLWLLARMAALNPDVVQIEWESVAVAYLPLLDLWSCPSVMSCHGGLDVFACGRYTAAWVADVPMAFARTSAVHCVSEAMLEEAVRHGLDPSKAFVLRAGIDAGLFVPAGT
jgi:hypothetical protein